MDKPPEYCLLWIDHWSTCMTKAEWSGWVQAFFSILAILFAVWISRRQAASQHATTMRAMESQHVFSRAGATRAAAVLADTAKHVLQLLRNDLPDRSAVHSNAAGLKPVVEEQLGHLLMSIDSLGYSDLPAGAVLPFASVSSQLWAVRTLLAYGLNHHEAMDSEDFERFFKTFDAALAGIEIARQQLEEIAKSWQDQDAIAARNATARA